VSAAANKKVVLDYLQALAEGRRSEARAAYAADAVYRAPPSMVGGEFHGPDEIFEQYFAVDKQMFDTGIQRYKWEILNAIAEGETVAVEMRHSSTMLNGDPYQTDYHVLYGMRDGKIAFVHEYFDSKYIDAHIKSLGIDFPHAPVSRPGRT